MTQLQMTCNAVAIICSKPTRQAVAGQDSCYRLA